MNSKKKGGGWGAYSPTRDLNASKYKAKVIEKNRVEELEKKGKEEGHKFRDYLSSSLQFLISFRRY